MPIAIKDEIDCMPYPTTGYTITILFIKGTGSGSCIIQRVLYIGGTKWMHKVRKCEKDACCVNRLRSCGAIIVGKTNMHELGAGISGINPHYG